MSEKNNEKKLERLVQESGNKFSFSQENQLNTQQGLYKEEIAEILSILVQNFNIDDELISRHQGEFLKKNANLREIYDLLIKKFYQSKKSREEIIKFIMRKAFKFLFNNLQQQSQKPLSMNMAHKMCMQHYFSNHKEGDFDILPFRKKSKIKTMNSKFLIQVFSSEPFVQDYKIFLASLTQILQKDNERKIKNISKAVSQYILTKKTQNIKKLRRMPWTMENIDQTRVISYQLLEYRNKQLQHPNLEDSPSFLDQQVKSKQKMGDLDDDYSSDSSEIEDSVEKKVKQSHSE